MASHSWHWMTPAVALKAMWIKAGRCVALLSFGAQFLAFAA
jgi:hypothetical protein